MSYTIVLGNKNYSSWSMRGWLALRHTGVSFDEEVIPLLDAAHAASRAERCPTGRVPVLYDGDLQVWDSLAIGEYLAERHPDAGLWPSGVAERATARAICAEVHSSFTALRTEMPMNVRARVPRDHHGEDLSGDLRRVFASWGECRARWAMGGPFLFGAWCLADVFFAPIVTRLQTYGVELADDDAAYAAAVLAQPAVAQWCEAALAEPWTIARYDP